MFAVRLGHNGLVVPVPGIELLVNLLKDFGIMRTLFLNRHGANIGLKLFSVRNISLELRKLFLILFVLGANVGRILGDQRVHLAKLRVHFNVLKLDLVQRLLIGSNNLGVFKILLQVVPINGARRRIVLELLLNVSPLRVLMQLAKHIVDLLKLRHPKEDEKEGVRDDKESAREKNGEKRKKRA